LLGVLPLPEAARVEAWVVSPLPACFSVGPRVLGLLLPEFSESFPLLFLGIWLGSSPFLFILGLGPSVIASKRFCGLSGALVSLWGFACRGGLVVLPVGASMLVLPVGGSMAVVGFAVRCGWLSLFRWCLGLGLLYSGGISSCPAAPVWIPVLVLLLPEFSWEFG